MEVAQLILGNSNKRFSGVTSTMLQTLPEVRKLMPLAVMGSHHLPSSTSTIRFWVLVLLRDRTRIFHARRNNEMIQALAARKLGAKIKIIFTSTAQRHHTRFTRWLISQMDGIITTCSAANSYLETPANIVIPHGIDLERYQPPIDKQKAWEALGFPGEFGIGIFGRVRPSKGIDILVDSAIHVLKNNPKPTVIIVGETTPKFRDYQNTLQAKIEKAGLSKRIHFSWKKAQQRSAWSFPRNVNCSSSFPETEGFGLTVPEAMGKWLCGFSIARRSLAGYYHRRTSRLYGSGR